MKSEERKRLDAIGKNSVPFFNLYLSGIGYRILSKGFNKAGECTTFTIIKESDYDPDGNYPPIYELIHFDYSGFERKHLFIDYEIVYNNLSNHYRERYLMELIAVPSIVSIPVSKKALYEFAMYNTKE